MAKRPCLDCGKPATGTRCTSCTRAKDAARGRRQARGYDANHDAVGRAYQAAMNNGQTFTCWRCRLPVGTRRGMDWQLGHCDNDKTQHHGPEHTHCNEATSSRVGQQCPHADHTAPQSGVGGPPGPTGL